MFMMDIANEHIRQESESGKLAETGRKNILFKQFIRLLLVHIREEHTVGWYASQLCVTPQYLNRAVKGASQRTYLYHVDRSHHRTVGKHGSSRFSDCRRFSFSGFGHNDQVLQETDRENTYRI